MKPNVVKAVNDQIQAEMSSAYTYLAMSAYFEDDIYPGAAAWLRTQWEEEQVHAFKFYTHLLERGEKVELQAIPKPKADWGTPLEAFEEVLKHEQYITQRIDDLYALAVDERDYPLQSLLQWFIDEQVEEEDNARSIIDRLKLAGNAGPGMLLVDQELGQRTTVDAEGE